MKLPSSYLTDGDTLLRHVTWAKLRKDEDDNVLGTLGTAFKLREDEEYLSATWCEFFVGSPTEQLKCAADSFRSTGFACSKKSRFALASVKNVTTFMHAEKRRVRIIHEPDEPNLAHAALRNWPDDDAHLLERLAEEVWATTASLEDIDKVSVPACAVSERGAKGL